MWDDFVAQQIRRTNRNLLILGTALLTIVAAIVTFTWRDVYNFLLGPFPAQPSDLAAIWNPDQSMRYYLKVQGEKSYPTGMQVVDANNKQLINAAPYKTDVMATRDILWAYPKVTKHYHNGIPAGVNYSAIVRDSKGQSMEISGKKDSVPKLLESLRTRMPWILVGYTKELDVLWQKEKPRFFQLMAQRRATPSMAPR